MVDFKQAVIDQLCKINTALLAIKKSIESKKEVKKDTYRGWAYTRIGYNWIFSREVTLQTSPNVIELPFGLPLELDQMVQLNRISQYFNSINPRTFNIRLFGNPFSSSAYDELDNQDANVARNRILPFGSEWQYPNASKLQFNYSNFTDGDKVFIQVHVTDLRGI